MHTTYAYPGSHISDTRVRACHAAAVGPHYAEGDTACLEGNRHVRLRESAPGPQRTAEPVRSAESPTASRIPTASSPPTVSRRRRTASRVTASRPTTANWFKRVGAYLIDGILGTLAALPLWIGYGMAIASAETVTNADGTVTTTMDDDTCPTTGIRRRTPTHRRTRTVSRIPTASRTPTASSPPTASRRRRTASRATASRPTTANWFKRVGAYLIDAILVTRSPRSRCGSATAWPSPPPRRPRTPTARSRPTMDEPSGAALLLILLGAAHVARVLHLEHLHPAGPHRLLDRQGRARA